MSDKDKYKGCTNLEEELEAYRETNRKEASTEQEEAHKNPEKHSKTARNKVIKNSYFMKKYFAPPGVNYDKQGFETPKPPSYPINMDNDNFGSGRRFSAQQWVSTTGENQQKFKNESGHKGRFSV